MRPDRRRAGAAPPWWIGRSRPVLAAEESAEPPLGESKPVEGGGVVVAHPARPGSIEEGAGVIVADRPVQVAERGGAEAELGKIEACAALPLPSTGFQGHACSSGWEERHDRPASFRLHGRTVLRTATGTASAASRSDRIGAGGAWAGRATRYSGRRRNPGPEALAATRRRSGKARTSHRGVSRRVQRT